MIVQDPDARATQVAHRHHQDGDGGGRADEDQSLAQLVGQVAAT
jgi:hypothetical protein